MIRKSFIFAAVVVCLGAAGFCSNSAAQDGYSIPLIAPDYPSPPYAYQNTKAMLVLFVTTPEALKKIVPEPLVPNQGNLMFLVIQALNTSGFKYNEVVLGAPATFRGKPVNYFAYLLLDRAEAISGGREIYGFPKKFGQISIEEKDGKVTARASRWGAALIDASVELARTLPPGTEEPPLPGVNLKLIPSVKKGAPPDVKQLTSTVAENYRLHEAKEGPATLSFGMSPFDPLYRIPIRKVLGGRYSTLDSTLSYGEVIYDYLKEK